MRKLNLINHSYGRLVVIGDAPSATDAKKSTMWKCRCECGNELIVRTDSLRSGNTKSCGCLAQETRPENSRKSAHKRINPDAELNLKIRMYKNNAETRGLHFNLSKEDCRYLFNQNCHYCSSDPPGGIDRIVNSNGYSIDNVLPCCGTCNRAKLQMSYQDFLMWIRRVYNNTN